MKAVMPTALPDILAFRKRTGADRWDEMWEGVLHMPPTPTPEHQEFGGDLFTFLKSHWVKRTGSKVYFNINLAAVGGWPDDYRIPDLVLLSPNSKAVQKGAYFEGPPDVVVEIRSPDDESFEKLAFYADLGVPEFWILDRDTKVATIYLLKNGHYEARAPEASGWILSEIAGIELRSIRPGKLSIRLRDDESTRADIPNE